MKECLGLVLFIMNTEDQVWLHEVDESEAWPESEHVNIVSAPVNDLTRISE